MRKRLFSFLVAGFLLMGMGCFNSECFAAPNHHKNHKATHQRNVKQSPHVKKAEPAPKNTLFQKNNPKNILVYKKTETIIQNFSTSNTLKM